MKAWKKGIIWFIALAVCCAAVLCGSAEEGIEKFSRPQVTYPEGGMSSTEAGEGYVRTRMGLERTTSSRRNSVTTSLLTEQEKHIYELLKPKLAQVAAGELADTKFSFPMSEIFPVSSLTAADMGLGTLYDGSGQVSYAALDAFYDMIMPDFGKVMSALMMDCPYEMYWFDKTNTGGMWWEYPQCTASGQTLSISDYSGAVYTLSFTVAKEYSRDNQYGTFVFDTAKGAAVQTAAANARAIVTANAGKTDYQKLKAYKDKICELVDYNDAAAYGGDTPYGNAWQLVWIFDNDPATKVVCEGYSKGFQYLCDLSSFSGNVSCVSYYGYMNGGAHMWNLVSIGGERYMADITNCDEGSSGYPDKLFLKGYTSKSTDENGNPVYGYKLDYTTLYYTYDKEIADLVPAEEMTVGDSPLGPDDGTFVSGSCGSLKWTMNGEGFLWVRGNGAIPAYGSGMWDRSKVTKIVISKGVTGIGADAFTGCGLLKETWFPETLTSIADNAFDPRDPEAYDQRVFYIPLCSLKAQIDWANKQNVQYYVAEHSNLVFEDDKAATCTEDGWEDWAHCSGCGFETIRVIPALGHNMVEDAAVEATCTEKGLSAGSHCTRCGYTVDRTETPALGHDPVTDPAVDTTCTADGSTEGSHCRRCGLVLVQPVTIPATGHDWDDGTITREPGYTEPGIRTYTCRKCGATREEETYIKIYLGKTGWVRNADGTWSYGDEHGDAAIGTKVIDGVMYGFTTQGIMISGWKQVEGKWYYAEDSGALCHKTWKKIGGVWYYFRDQGDMAVGWLQDGWTRYYLNSGGAMVTGWQKLDGTWYYFSPDGAMITGWLKDGGVWYWLDRDGKMATGWVKDGGVWYYMASSGAMKTGWVKIDGDWYYFNDSGAMATGWLLDGNTWYFMRREDGVMLTGEQVIDGRTWWFGADGAWIR